MENITTISKKRKSLVFTNKTTEVFKKEFGGLQDIKKNKTEEEEEDKVIYGTCVKINNYAKINRIGEGTYGTVYKALDKKSNTIVALKRILMHNEKMIGFPLSSLREISALKQCENNKHCVNLLDIVVGRSRDSIFLVLDYAEHDLSKLTKKFKKPFKESEIKTLILQLLSALSYLHSKKIVHRDIKMSNLLYNNQGELKLADFGLSRAIPIDDNVMTLEVVTLWYRSPELLLGSTRYSYSIDIWSVGCVLCELYLDHPVFQGKDEIDQIYEIFKILGAPSVNIWSNVINMPLIIKGTINLDIHQNKYKYNNISELFPDVNIECLDFINLLLALDPTQRITAVDAILHDYFDKSPYMIHSSLMPTFPSSHINLKSDAKEK
jgi:serine/threonine protein kinase